MKTKTKKFRLVPFLFIAFCFWLVRFCSPNELPPNVDVPVIELIDFPDKAVEYEGKLVVVAGRVIESVWINGVATGYYKIADQSDNELMIYTRLETTPTRGELVAVLVEPKLIFRINEVISYVAIECDREIIEELHSIAPKEDPISYVQ